MRLTMSRWTLGRDATRPLRRILRRLAGAGRGLMSIMEFWSAGVLECWGGAIKERLRVDPPSPKALRRTGELRDSAGRSRTAMVPPSPVVAGFGATAPPSSDFGATRSGCSFSVEVMTWFEFILYMVADG